jgi:hypothetical protein
MYEKFDVPDENRFTVISDRNEDNLAGDSSMVRTCDLRFR